MSEIVADPALHREAKAVAPLLAARAEPAGDDAVRRALQPLVLVYGIGEAARVPAFWMPYRILADQPITALVQGIADYTAGATSEFFPKPGPLKALCDRHAEPVRKAAFRARKAAQMPPPKPIHVVSEDEKAAVARMVAEATKSLSSAAANAFPHRNIDLPSTAGKPDAGGLTPQMRALMERRGSGA